MRKITQKAVTAFKARQNFNSDNTQVRNIGENLTEFRLYGNLIAIYEKKSLAISHCGYLTNTTKERLNGILFEFFGGDYYIKQIKFDFVLHRNRGDGKILKDIMQEKLTIRL